MCEGTLYLTLSWKLDNHVPKINLFIRKFIFECPVNQLYLSGHPNSLCLWVGHTVSYGWMMIWRDSSRCTHINIPYVWNAIQQNDSIRGLFSAHRGRPSEGEEDKLREGGSRVVSIYGGDNKLNQALLLLLLAVSTSTAIAWLWTTTADLKFSPTKALDYFFIRFYRFHRFNKRWVHVLSRSVVDGLLWVVCLGVIDPRMNGTQIQVSRSIYL